MIKWRDLNETPNRLEDLRKTPPRELFGLEEPFTERDLKNAYRKLIKLYHPDRLDDFLKGHGSEVSKIINEAYETIKREID